VVGSFTWLAEFIIYMWLITGVIAGAIAWDKNLRVGLPFLLGAVLGVIGIIIVAVSTPGRVVSNKDTMIRDWVDMSMLCLGVVGVAGMGSALILS
jgi:hypothetical protein